MKTGLPLPRGSVNSDDTFVVFDADNQRVSCVITPSAYWPDNSIKWCLVKLAVLAEESEATTVRVFVNDPAKTDIENSPPVPLVVNSSDTSISIRETRASTTDSDIEFTFDRTGQFIFPEVKINEQIMWAFGDNFPSFNDAGETDCKFNIDTINIEEQDAISCVCAVSYTHLTLPTNREV